MSMIDLSQKISQISQIARQMETNSGKHFIYSMMKQFDNLNDIKNYLNSDEFRDEIAEYEQCVKTDLMLAKEEIISLIPEKYKAGKSNLNFYTVSNNFKCETPQEKKLKKKLKKLKKLVKEIEEIVGAQ